MRGRTNPGRVKVDRRCHGTLEMTGPSVEIYARGTESAANAITLLSQAESHANDLQYSMDAIGERSYAPPKEVVRTVKETVVLTVPVPSPTLVPYYTVIGPDRIVDGYGRTWWYRYPRGWYY